MHYIIARKAFLKDVSDILFCFSIVVHSLDSTSDSPKIESYNKNCGIIIIIIISLSQASTGI